MAEPGSIKSTWKYITGRATASFIVSYIVSLGYFIMGIGSSPLINGLAALGVAVLFTLIISLSRDVRCILTLCIPEIFTGIGRKILFFLLFFFLIGQPMFSIISNATSLEKLRPCIRNATKVQIQEAFKIDDEMFVQNSQVNFKKLSTTNDKNDVDPLNIAINRVESDMKGIKHDLVKTYDNCKVKTEKAYKLCKDNNVRVDICETFRSDVLCSAVKIDGISLSLGQLKTESMKLKNYFNVRVDPSSQIKVISRTVDSIDEIQENVHGTLRDNLLLYIYIGKIFHYITAAVLVLIIPLQAFYYKQKVLDLQVNASSETHTCFCDGYCDCDKFNDAKKHGIEKKVGFRNKVKKAWKMVSLSFVVYIAAGVLLGIAYVLYVGISSVGHDSFASYNVQILFPSEMSHASKNITVNIGDCIDEPVPPCSLVKVILIFSLTSILTILVFFKQWLLSKRIVIVKFFYPEEFTIDKEIIRLNQLKLEQAKTNRKLAEERVDIENVQTKLKNENQSVIKEINQRIKRQAQKEVEVEVEVRPGTSTRSKSVNYENKSEIDKGNKKNKKHGTTKP